MTRQPIALIKSGDLTTGTVFEGGAVESSLRPEEVSRAFYRYGQQMVQLRPVTEDDAIRLWWGNVEAPR